MSLAPQTAEDVAGDVFRGFAEGMPGVSPGIYGERDFLAVAELVRAEAGIVLPRGKAMLVYSRLAPLVRNSGLGTFSAYLATLRENDGERRKVVCALTTNHTFFYREEHHFEHFAANVRPALVAALGAGEAVRMWSAGCSSGEEVFSLVMTLLGPNRGEGRALARRDLRVLASDIDDNVLNRAGAGRYDAKGVAAVPDDLRDAWVVQDAGGVTIASDVRDLVQFRHLNLHGEWPMKRLFQVIFCRNVMIYFDNPTKERLLARLARQLVPGGFLYIGHSERVSGPAEAELQTVGPTIYRRRTR